MQQRAITDVFTQKLLYGLIIAGEYVFGVLCTLGGLFMLAGLFNTNRRDCTDGNM